MIAGNWQGAVLRSAHNDARLAAITADGTSWTTGYTPGRFVVVEVVAGTAVVAVVAVVVVCAEAMLAANSITPKKVRLLRLRIVFFIWILSYYAVMDGGCWLN